MGIKAPKLKGMSPEEVGRFVLEAKVKTANIRFNDWLKESRLYGKGRPDRYVDADRKEF